ncbi:ABC transporter substrate-binding protein [Paenibacillus sp. 2TAB19]|uniref:ABC transporter substrate-binding protein n=1 Tax=Paenibacillus sp. 2TAB19 TaxID=3233003 RepID=UPI003F99196C
MNRLQGGIAWLLLLAALSLLIGCTRQQFAAGPSAEQTIRLPVEAGKLKFGYSGNSIFIGLKEQGKLEAKLALQSIVLEWTSYDDDAALYEAIEAGRVDIGSVGDATPAFLYREGSSVVYLAAEPANPTAYAVAVPLDSDIYSADDLKGKKIGYTSYSNEHLLLLQVLASVQLKQKDVKSVELSPAEVEPSFADGKADAWVIGEPERSEIEALGLRVIADGSASAAKRDILVSTQESMEGREALFELVLAEIGVYEEWVTSNVHDAAELLTTHTSIEHISWLGAFSRKAYGTAPLLESIAKDEQLVIDTVASLGGRKKEFGVDELLK